MFKNKMDDASPENSDIKKLSGPVMRRKILSIVNRKEPFKTRLSAEELFGISETNVGLNNSVRF
jgi:hypothetical protein